MNDLRYALRMLMKAPGFTLAAVIALALGIGATTAMFGVIYAFLLRPLPYVDSESLVMLQSRSTRSGSDLGVNYQDFADWETQARSFSDLAFFNLRWNGNLESRDGATETLKTTFTTANLFALLGVQPIAGRNLLPSDDEANAPKVMLISHRVWTRAFGGDPAVIGRQLNLDGTSRTVVGVMPPGFRFPSQTDLWVPMRAFFAGIDDRSWRADQAIGRLRPGVTVAQTKTEMTLIAERLARAHPIANKDVGAAVVPLRDHWTGDVRGSMLLLLAACGGVLLIACANVSQLLLARATSRQRELAVRAALGASRLRLARQLLAESALLTLIGGAAGVVLAFWLVGLVAASIPIELPLWVKIEVNPSVLAFTVAVTSLTALLAGLLPAWHATRIDLADSLKTTGAGNTGGTARGRRTAEVLTSVQVAVSIVLLVGASLILRSIAKLQEVDPGFDAHGVLMMEVNPTFRNEPAQVQVDRYARVLDRLGQVPGVQGAAANNSPPFTPQRPWNRMRFTAEGQTDEEQRANPLSNFQTVSADYFRLLHVPLLRGRAFDERDKLDAPSVCIVSKRLAERLWPEQDAIGQRLTTGRPEDDGGPNWMTVVGIVGDVRHQTLGGEAGPDLYNHTLQLAWKQTHFLVRARSGAALSLVPAIQREVAAVAPDVGVFNFVSLEQEVADSLWQVRLRGWLIGFFSIVALSLAAAGLYGTMAHSVVQRTREIGIRMALGATCARVLRLVVGQGMRAVVAGVAVGLAGALILARVLQASLFGVAGSDPCSYAAACLLLAMTTGVACFLPARRATRVNPMEALRHE